MATVDSTEDMPKDFTDSDGNRCSLDTMCRREPEWAANMTRQARARVRELEAAVLRGDEQAPESE